jgi:hypothetical protein
LTTFSDVIAYVTNQATKEESMALFDAANARLKSLRAATAAENIASLKPDTPVKLGGLKPKYLNDLTGIVVGVEGTRVKVKLDEASRRTAGRYANPFDHTILAPASAVAAV